MNGFYPSLRTASAQATTGQTDWLYVPSWARYLSVYLNLTANAGTSPETTFSFQATPLGLQDDANLTALGTGAVITAASQHYYQIGPDLVVGTDSATADASVGFSAVLPVPFIGVRILNDRTTGDETYTYTLTARFSR